MNSNNTSLVPFGTNPSSNVGKRQFSRLVASMVILTPFVFGVVIGILLSDGYLQFLNSRTAVNAALGITQSLAHFKYLWLVFLLEKPPLRMVARRNPAGLGCLYSLVLLSFIAKAFQADSGGPRAQKSC